MKLFLLAVLSIFTLHALILALWWLGLNAQYIKPDLAEGLALVACALGLVWGIALIRRSRRSRWDFGAECAAHRQAKLRAVQKAHELDNRRF